MRTPQEPRLRQVSKTNPLYPINKFPPEFVKNLAQHICVRLATRGDSDLEGQDWEKIFADCIGAKHTPSNIGLDDITHIASSTAWGAKTVKGKVDTSSIAASKKRTVRLISGRNSTTYSYGEAIDPKKTEPNDVGEMVIGIWNQRVKEVRARFENLRTVVLIKDEGLNKLAVFEHETELYIPTSYRWLWNKRNNLEGYDEHECHRFTWQPHGSQFTIVEEIPEDTLRIQIKTPTTISKKRILEEIGFDNDFYETI
jgi:hypothetical protein